MFYLAVSADKLREYFIITKKINRFNIVTFLVRLL